jgi:hypothetical protein
MYGKCLKVDCKFKHEAPTALVEETKVAPPTMSKKEAAPAVPKKVKFEQAIPSKKEEAKLAFRENGKKTAETNQDRPCRAFQTKGYCKWGKKCFYSHAIPKVALANPVKEVKPVLKASKPSAVQEEVKKEPTVQAPQEWSGFKFPGMPET